MTSKKYRSYGIRRENNLVDINNKEESLNNILNNLPGVGEDNTFISQDLDAIRGLRFTSIDSTDFIGLAASTPRVTLIDEEGNLVTDANGDPLIEIIRPIYRLEDRLRAYRKITEDPPVFSSGMGPSTYFIPSNLLPALTKGSNLNSINITTTQASNLIQTSDDFWVAGEFVINDKIRTGFPDSYGGILWEGYYIPNINATVHGFSYETTGLFHVEYDRFGNNDWEIVKSIYAKQRTVTVAAAVTAANIIQLAPGDGRFVSRNDFVFDDIDNVITGISSDTISLSKPITRAINSTITFDMNLGQDRYFGNYTINEVLDRAETPQIKKRMLWWYPLSASYDPDIKYLRNTSSGERGYNYFSWNKTRSTVTANPGSIRDLLEKAVTPAQPNMGGTGNYVKFKSTFGTNTVYSPKSAFTQIDKGAVTITTLAGNKSIQGALTNSELGNYIVPITPSALNTIIPKNLKIKNVIGVIDSSYRIVTETLLADGTVPVRLIDHVGLIDYFVASSAGDIVTVSDTTKLKKDMICITPPALAVTIPAQVVTDSNDFVRITEILTPTTFRTSVNLNLSSNYIYIYSNSGIIDRSLETFCVGVFGQRMASTATSGDQLTLTSVAGIATGQVVQFRDSIPTTPITTVTAINGNVITISTPIVSTIIQGETLVFSPAGGPTVNKEICVLPLDLSPPFIGVPTGLSSNGKSIKGSRTKLNVKTNNITFNSSVVSTVPFTGENYDRKILMTIIDPVTKLPRLASILAKLVI